MSKLTLSFKGRTLAVHHLEQGSNLIGRESDCAIAIDSLAVAPRHAEVTMKDHTCRIRALDESSPLYVNESKVAEAELSHGDLIRVGKHTLSFSDDVHSPRQQAREPSRAPAPAAGKAQTPSVQAYVQILSGDHIGRIIPLSQGMTRIGRQGGNRAMIVYQNDAFYLSHLEGTPPSLDGVPIGDEKVMLSAGSVIRIGGTELQFYR